MQNINKALHILNSTYVILSENLFLGLPHQTQFSKQVPNNNMRLDSCGYSRQPCLLFTFNMKLGVFLYVNESCRCSQRCSAPFPNALTGGVDLSSLVRQCAFMCFGGVALEGSERRGWDFLWFYTFKIYLTLAGLSRTLALSN